MNTCFKLLAAYLCISLGPLLHASEKSGNSSYPDSDVSEIINGNDGSITDTPWVVFLASAEGSQFCGASLISPTWVLTAAHCLPTNEEGTAVDLVEAVKNQVILNSVSSNPIADDAIYAQIGQVIPHPNYGFDTTDNDLALIELTAAVNLTPVSLVDQGTTVPDGTYSTVLGWGAVDQLGQNPSGFLLQTDQLIVSAAACNAAYGDSITENMICANGYLGRKDISDSCSGDSGGPLIANTQNGPLQLGIVSFGGGQFVCGEVDIPGVYANVANLASFIKQHATDATFVSNPDFVTFLSYQPPDLTINVEGNSVTASWTPVAGATGYIVYYAPLFPVQGASGSVDMKAMTQLTAELPSGSAYYLAVHAYNESEVSTEFSNVGIIRVD